MTTDAQAVATDLDMQTMFAQMQAALAAQQAEIAALRAARNEDTDGSLAQALREFEAQHVTDTAWTASPCQHVDGNGRTCGRRFSSHVSERDGVRAEVADHTFRLTPLRHSDKPKPRAFYAKDEPTQRVDPTESVQDTYLSVAQAAKALGMKAAEVKALVADGQLKADKIGSTVLVRKVAVDRLLALAQVAEDDAEVI